MSSKKSRAKEEKAKRKSQAVHDAIRRGSLSEIKKLMRKLAVDAPNSAQQTPLHTASIEGQVTVINYLLKKNADVNARDRDGWTPLHCACHSGHLKIVEILIVHNAEVCVETANGSVPLDYFVRISEQDAYSALFERLFRTMVRKGADVNRPNSQGEYPLHMAASRGKELSVSLLLLNQANPNALNKNGESALHLAVRGGFVKCVNKLLHANADWKLQGGQSGNCLTVAKDTNNQAILDAFKEYLGLKEYELALSDQSTNTKQPGTSPEPKIYISTSDSDLPLDAGSLPLSFTELQGTLDIDNASFTRVPDATGSWNAGMGNEFSLSLLSPRSPGSMSPTSHSPRGFSVNTSSYGRTSLSPSKPDNFHKHSRTQSTSAQTSPRSPRKRSKRVVSARFNSDEPQIKIASNSAPETVGNYSLGDCIGSGAFGSVYSALDKETGELVAIKRISLSGIPKSELDDVMAELDLLQRLEFKNITRYIGFFKDKDHLNIVLEFVEGGSLAMVVQKFGGIGEHLCAKYISQTLQGLEYLHQQDIVHRDIKCANILVTKEGTIKLADFGIASVVDHTKESKRGSQDVAGSPYWMAPEVIKLKGATTASDIWSLGCTIIELITGNPPFGELAPMAAIFAMVKEDHPPFPTDISPELNNFLQLCFCENDKRASASELLRHDWIRNNMA